VGYAGVEEEVVGLEAGASAWGREEKRGGGRRERRRERRERRERRKGSGVGVSFFCREEM